MLGKKFKAENELEAVKQQLAAALSEVKEIKERKRTERTELKESKEEIERLKAKLEKHSLDMENKEDDFKEERKVLKKVIISFIFIISNYK